MLCCDQLAGKCLPAARPSLCKVGSKIDDADALFLVVALQFPKVPSGVGSHAAAMYNSAFTNEASLATILANETNFFLRRLDVQTPPLCSAVGDVCNSADKSSISRKGSEPAGTNPFGGPRPVTSHGLSFGKVEAGSNAQTRRQEEVAISTSTSETIHVSMKRYADHK